MNEVMLNQAQIRKYYLLKNIVMEVITVVLAIIIAAIFSSLFGMSQWITILTATVAGLGGIFQTAFLAIQMKRKVISSHLESATEPREIVMAKLRSSIKRNMAAQLSHSLLIAGFVITFINYGNLEGMWLGISIVLIGALLAWTYILVMKAHYSRGK